MRNFPTLGRSNPADQRYQFPVHAGCWVFHSERIVQDYQNNFGTLNYHMQAITPLP
jgi:hypothetical protein